VSKVQRGANFSICNSGGPHRRPGDEPFPSNGFINDLARPVSRWNTPVELKRLIDLEMEGSVG